MDIVVIQGEISRPDGATVAFTLFRTMEDSDALPLVFVPGWLCDASGWLDTARRLSSRRTCVTLDLPGFGRSKAGQRHDWSLAAFGADVAAIVAELPGRRAILVGHSMGGAVTLEAAIAAPEAISQVIGVDSLLHAAFYDATPDRLIEDFVVPFSKDFATAVASTMQAYVLTNGPAEVDDAIAVMASADSELGLAVLREFLRWDVETSLATVRAPVSIIAAAGLLTPDAAKRWQGRGLFCVPDVGHFIMLDSPDRFDRALLAAIDQR